MKFVNLAIAAYSCALTQASTPMDDLMDIPFATNLGDPSGKSNRI